jgi:hypothetical protein
MTVVGLLTDKLVALAVAALGLVLLLFTDVDQTIGIGLITGGAGVALGRAVGDPLPPKG